MKKAPSQIISEFLWITLRLSVTFLLAVLLFGWSFVKGEFVPWLLLFSLFIVVTFIINRIMVNKKTTKISGH